MKDLNDVKQGDVFCARCHFRHLITEGHPRRELNLHGPVIGIVVAREERPRSALSNHKWYGLCIVGGVLGSMPVYIHEFLR